MTWSFVNEQIGHYRKTYFERTADGHTVTLNLIVNAERDDQFNSGRLLKHNLDPESTEIKDIVKKLARNFK